MITDHPIPRPPSEQLVDLHVYILPREAWNEKYSSTYNESISEAKSAGFVRVWPELTVAHLRMVIEDEIGRDFLPPNYVFLRSVGRCMTQIKPKQEHELKCKAFLPPTAWAPEIVVLEPPRDSMTVPLYQSFPGYSPRVDTTQPISGIPTHFPQVTNHDRMAPSTDGLGEEFVETSQDKDLDKSSHKKEKIAKSTKQNLTKDPKATSRLAKKTEAKPELGNKKNEAKLVIGDKKTASRKAPQSKAGLERAKRLKQTQALWSKDAKRAKIAEATHKNTESVGQVESRTSRARKVETGLDQEQDNGKVKTLRKLRSESRKAGKLGQLESTKTVPRLQGKVIEVLPVVKADRLSKVQDRTVQTSGIYIGMNVPSQHNTHSSLVPGDSPTMHPASIQAPIGQLLPPSTSLNPSALPSSHPNINPSGNLNPHSKPVDSAYPSNIPIVANPNDAAKRIDNPDVSNSNSVSFNTVQPLPDIAHSPNLLVVKSQSSSRSQPSTMENVKKSHPLSSRPADFDTTQSNSDDTNPVAGVASPTNNNHTTNNIPNGEDQNATQATAATTGDLHHTNIHHHHHNNNNIHQSDSRRLSRIIDSSSVSFPAPLSATPPDTPSSDTPLPGQSPMMVQQQGYKGDPLQQSLPGKSGRPDAYTNNTNEDSGIAEPTPEEDDLDYERRKSDVDDQYFNQLQPNQTRNGQFQEDGWNQDDQYNEKGIQKERRRQAEIKEREEEESRKEEERKIEEQKQKEEQRQREEERKEHERRLEKRRQEDAKKERQKEMERKWEEEQKRKEDERMEEQRMKEEMEIREAERLFEEERRQSIVERVRAEAYDGALPLDDVDTYDDASMEVNQTTESRSQFLNQTPDSRSTYLNEDQMRRRAEDELRDYEPQSSWKPDDEGEMSHALHHPGRRSRSREDTEMEIASQQAVQDGLKRVHLTPEIHRKAKIGKIRNSSITDEEDIYETNPEMAGLLAELQIARQERMKREKEREMLIKKAKELQTKTHERRNRFLNESKPRPSSITPDPVTHPRDYWKKRYYDEKKKTAPLEEQSVSVKNQLGIMHRKLLSHIEGKKKGPMVKGPPSKKNDHKINIIKMQHELDELRRQVDNSRMKLTSEIKLRNQAEAEVRGLKSDLTQRKINMTLIRNQKLAALKTADTKLLSKTPIPALGQGPSSFSAKR